MRLVLIHDVILIAVAPVRDIQVQVAVRVDIGPRDSSRDVCAGNEFLVGYGDEICRTIVEVELVVNVLSSFRAVRDSHIDITVEVEVAPGMTFLGCSYWRGETGIVQAKSPVTIVQVQVILVAVPDIGNEQIEVAVVVHIGC